MHEPEHEPEHTPTPAPAAQHKTPPEPEGTTRQNLVVPPRHSSLPVVLGAIVCAGTGFGLVWAIGLGRSAGITESSVVSQAASGPVGDGESLREPGPFPQTGIDAHPPRAISDRDRDLSDRGLSPLETPVAAPPATIDRYPTRPATLQAPEQLPESSLPMSPAQDGRTSRFAPPGRFPGTGNESVRLASAESAPAADQLPPEPDVSDRATDASPSTDARVVGEDAASDASLSGVSDPSADSRAAPTAPAADDLLAPANPVSANPVSDNPAPAATDLGESAVAPSPPAAAPAPAPAPAPFPPSAADPAAFGGSVEPPAPPRRFTSTDIAPPTSFRPAIPAPASPPSPAPVISAAATNPFASAPPMGPTGSPRGEPAGNRPFQSAPNPLGSGLGSMQAQGQGSAPGFETAGQGRPGPMQLEGLQTPQLAVEKRGPREIQVGKAARYEILVRNVGSATAQDVTLRDAVPYGTTLITTTPPASPAGSPSNGPGAPVGGPPVELLWPLGTLVPGGEARVSMEVMPQIEGEIGSVASVSFRTEASARSRATKPALSLEASEAKAVRIGGEVRLSLKVSNPGTGVATGVVLEGVLPEGVSHSAGRELEFDVGQLRPGDSKTIDLVMGSRGPGIHMANFVARADGRLEVEQSVRIEVTAPTLELSTEMPARRYLQRPATCVLSMINAGTATARSVELAAQLPPGMKFVRANHAGWYEERSHRVLWNLEELPPGEVGTVEMVLMPVDLGPQKIVAAARSSDGPSDQKIHTVEVEGLAALFFEVTDSEDPIEVGGMTEYIVRIGNQGTKAASGVRLTATLLGDLEPVDAKGPAAHRIDNLAVVFEPLAKLAPSEEAVFRVRVRGRREGDQRMQVQLMSDDHPSPITKEETTRVYSDR